MGGFLLVKNDSKSINIKKALSIFDSKALKLNRKIITNEFSLYIFNKKSIVVENFFEFNQSDFILSIGTPVYKNELGSKGATLLYEDLQRSKTLNFSNFSGHYCYVISINKILTIFNDFNGLYHVYHDINNDVFSSSFLAISESLPTKDISIQSLYEYIFCESTFGNETLLTNIKQLDNKHIYQLSPRLEMKEKQYIKDSEPDYSKFSQLVEFTSDRIINFFQLMQKFNSISQGLSGGFDSRLILMCLLKYDIKPIIYTSGDVSSFDVQFSKSICSKYGLEFTHYDLNKRIDLSENYESLTKEKFINSDGIVYNGIFTSIGKDMDIKQSRKAELNLNGAGGEIYRSFWKLPGRSSTSKNFVNSRYINFNFNIPTDKYDHNKFIQTLAKKNFDSLDVKPLNENEKIPGDLIELLYPNFRLRHWFGKTTSRLNQFCYAMVPFAEPYFYFYSHSIPMKFKIGGKFESALLKKINPELAKYDSDYGFNFFDGPSAKYKMIDWLKLQIPVSMRPFLRKRKSAKSDDLSTLKNNFESHFGKPTLVSEFVNLNEVNNLSLYSRILTIEYFMKNFM